MPSDPKIRCGDADRERTAALLREHHAAGRLTAEEFHERLDKAYAAKTQSANSTNCSPTCPRSTCTRCPTPRCAVRRARATLPASRWSARQISAWPGGLRQLTRCSVHHLGGAGQRLSPWRR